MKFLVNIVLLMFITFLSTPTLIGMLDKEVDTSCFYSLAEEEENIVSFNEIKSIPSTHYAIVDFEIEENTSSSISKQHNFVFFNLAHQIFSPPPNKI